MDEKKRREETATENHCTCGHDQWLTEIREIHRILRIQDVEFREYRKKTAEVLSSINADIDQLLEDPKTRSDKHDDVYAGYIRTVVRDEVKHRYKKKVLPEIDSLERRLAGLEKDLRGLMDSLKKTRDHETEDDPAEES